MPLLEILAHRPQLRSNRGLLGILEDVALVAEEEPTKDESQQKDAEVGNRYGRESLSRVEEGWELNERFEPRLTSDGCCVGDRTQENEYGRRNGIKQVEDLVLNV